MKSYGLYFFLLILATFFSVKCRFRDSSMLFCALIICYFWLLKNILLNVCTTICPHSFWWTLEIFFFQFLAVTNKADVIICIGAFVWAFSHFIYLFTYLFIFGCVGSSFLCEGFLSLWQAEVTLHRSARASHYRGLSCCGAYAPDAQAQQLWLKGPAAPWHVGSSQTRARTRVPCIGRQILNHCATREAPNHFKKQFLFSWILSVTIEYFVFYWFLSISFIISFSPAYFGCVFLFYFWFLKAVTELILNFSNCLK